MPIMVGMEMRMGVMAFKTHGKILTRLIRDPSPACQTDGMRKRQLPDRELAIEFRRSMSPI